MLSELCLKSPYIFKVKIVAIHLNHFTDMRIAI